MLRTYNILNDNSIPHQEYITKGLFVVKPTMIDCHYYQKEVDVTRVTPSGFKFIVDMIDKNLHREDGLLTLKQVSYKVSCIKYLPPAKLSSWLRNKGLLESPPDWIIVVNSKYYFKPHGVEIIKNELLYEVNR